MLIKEPHLTDTQALELAYAATSEALAQAKNMKALRFRIKSLVLRIKVLKPKWLL